MKKIVFCNLDLLKKDFSSSDYSEYDFSKYDKETISQSCELFVEAVRELSKDDINRIYFYSRYSELINQAKEVYGDTLNFSQRQDVENFVNGNTDKNNYFIFVGNKDADFLAAVHSKSVYVVPDWLPVEEKAVKYGIHVGNAKEFRIFIQTFNNQNVWYSQLKIDDVSSAYSLFDARYGSYAETMEEKEMVYNFQKLLKDDLSQGYRSILLYHFLAGMTNIHLFDDIELFGMIPSSDCTLNSYVYDFMTRVRVVKGKRLPKNYDVGIPVENTNLIIRHTSKTQNHGGGRDREARMRLGATDEFETIMINPDYKKKITTLKKENKFNVCIFDDYMTYGNSFNAVRNLLENLGANKIIFVSIGLFRNPFQKKDYSISGNVFGKTYSYKLEETVSLNNFIINDKAKTEISDLHDIFYS